MAIADGDVIGIKVEPSAFPTCDMIFLCLF